MALTDKEYYAATFDLQAVLTTLCGSVGELYYMCKLCVYNLSIYSLKDGKSHCHVWDETQGKRGSCEMATCIYKNSVSVSSDKTIKVLTYYSDNCPGQNRNTIVASSLLYTLSKLENVEVINHTFLERGHSNMECDSIHITIEHSKKNTSVYVPSNWNTVISMARRNNPYLFIPMKHDDVMNFKLFSSVSCPNFKMASTGEKINWTKVCWVQVRKDSPQTIFVNYSFNEEFLEINVQHIGTRNKKRKYAWMDDVPALYMEKIPISKAKKKDLLSLCTKCIIPEEYHEYYKNLPSSNIKVCIPTPSQEEEEYDTDIE